jgi:hypothetical protein
VYPCAAGTGNALPVRFKQRNASPPIGGFEWGTSNQSFLPEEDAEPDVAALLAAAGVQQLDAHNRPDAKADSAPTRKKRRKRQADDGELERTEKRSHYKLETSSEDDADKTSRGERRKRQKSKRHKHERKRERFDDEADEYLHGHAGGERTSKRRARDEHSPAAGQRHDRHAQEGRGDDHLQSQAPQHKNRSNRDLKRAIALLVEQGYDVQDVLAGRL